MSFLLPIPTVLTPSSLRVVPHTLAEWQSCQVPTGNLTNGGSGSILYLTGGWGMWTGVTPVAQKLSLSTLVGQQILSLPQACGPDCTYSVSYPSIAFQCQPGVEVPEDMKGTFKGGATVGTEVYWNATTTQPSSAATDPTMPFYVYWKSSQNSGTSGQGLCSVGLAKYDVTIEHSSGQQSVSYNVTHIGDLITTKGDNVTMEEWNYALQLSSLAFSARALLLGSLSTMMGASDLTPSFDSSVTSAAFFDPSLDSGMNFMWGDVLGGIEQLSHNISTGILSMDLGVQNSRCFMNTHDIVYQYDRLNLWLPYGIAFLLVSLCLAIGTLVFLRLNRENLTASFSDTVDITRNSSLDTFVRDDGA
ncbi:hypothetical protein FRB90_003416, partial [Tulasnella sp. 427]